jgi:acyl carrier protein
LDLDEVVTAIRETVYLNHDLQVYAIALIKPASIPKTSSGKIQRRTCRENFVAGTLNLVGEWTQKLVTTDVMTENPSEVNKETITTWLLTKLAGVLGIEIDELETDTPFSHYGLDSSVALSLTGELGEWINLELEPTLFWEYTNIAELTEYLEELEDE